MPSDATVYGKRRELYYWAAAEKRRFYAGQTFKLGERQNLRFRTDFFNLFNHPSFAIPALASVSSAGGSAPD